MRRESLKRAAQMHQFRLLRDAYLEGHPRCEFPLGCAARAVLVHHKRGKAGKRLLDVTWFAASCWYHNDYAETHTGHSLQIGWLYRVESVDVA